MHLKMYQRPKWVQVHSERGYVLKQKTKTDMGVNHAIMPLAGRITSNGKDFSTGEKSHSSECLRASQHQILSYFGLSPGVVIMGFCPPN